MDEQKVLRVGNSLAVTLPNDFVKARKIKAGQNIFVETDADLDLIQIRTKAGSKSALTPEFKEWLDDISKKYEDVIKELAKR